MDYLREKVGGDYDMLVTLLGGPFAGLYNSKPGTALAYLAIFEQKFGREHALTLRLQQCMCHCASDKQYKEALFDLAGEIGNDSLCKIMDGAIASRDNVKSPELLANIVRVCADTQDHNKDSVLSRLARLDAGSVLAGRFPLDSDKAKQWREHLLGHPGVPCNTFTHLMRSMYDKSGAEVQPAGAAKRKGSGASDALAKKPRK
jgi:hypothetical protein